MSFLCGYKLQDKDKQEERLKENACTAVCDGTPWSHSPMLSSRFCGSPAARDALRARAEEFLRALADKTLLAPSMNENTPYIHASRVHESSRWWYRIS